MEYDFPKVHSRSRLPLAHHRPSIAAEQCCAWRKGGGGLQAFHREKDTTRGHQLPKPSESELQALWLGSSTRQHCLPHLCRLPREGSAGKLRPVGKGCGTELAEGTGTRSGRTWPWADPRVQG